MGGIAWSRVAPRAFGVEKVRGRGFRGWQSRGRGCSNCSGSRRNTSL